MRRDAAALAVRTRRRRCPSGPAISTSAAVTNRASSHSCVAAILLIQPAGVGDLIRRRRRRSGRRRSVGSSHTRVLDVDGADLQPGGGRSASAAARSLGSSANGRSRNCGSCSIDGSWFGTSSCRRLRQAAVIGRGAGEDRDHDGLCSCASRRRRCRSTRSARCRRRCSPGCGPLRRARCKRFAPRAHQQRLVALHLAAEDLADRRQERLQVVGRDHRFAATGSSAATGPATAPGYDLSCVIRKRRCSAFALVEAAESDGARSYPPTKKPSDRKNSVNTSGDEQVRHGVAP